MSSKTLTRKGDKVEVTLKKPHTHGGVEYAPGDKIKVWPDQKEVLAKHGSI